jgi:hypothetical protein
MAEWIFRVALALCFLVPLSRVVVSAVRRAVAARSRRDLEAGIPTRLTEPPGIEDPGVVTLLAGDGRRLSRRAIAATILDLADRGVVALDGTTSERFVLRVSEDAKGEHHGETLVLDALRARAVDRKVVGPPIWEADRQARELWRRYKRDVFKRARQTDVIVRLTDRSGLLGGGVLAWILASIAAAVIGFEVLVWFVLAIVAIGASSFTRPYLTDEGWLAMRYWQAYATYVREQGNLRDVGAPAVHVWGHYLVNGVALGEAPAAARALAPEGDAEGPGVEV